MMKTTGPSDRVIACGIADDNSIRPMHAMSLYIVTEHSRTTISPSSLLVENM